LLVGNATANTSFGNGTIDATGNITASYFLGNGSQLTGINGSNVSNVANANYASFAGIVVDSAQPNITSVGTLTSLTVTGNVTSGNVNANNAVFTGTGSFGGNVNMNSFTITGLATPNATSDAATKQYVDDVAQGLNVHDAVVAATTNTLAIITGGTVTYDNGTAGVGATLTTTGTFNLIDSANIQTVGTRILVKNEANAVHNGIYTWSNATVITRATDYNSVPEVEAGDFVFCSGGSTYDNTGWVQTDSPTAIGTAGNNINFTQFSGAGTYDAGTGLTLTGTTFSVNATQSQITSVGSLTGLTVSNATGVVNFSNTANVTLGNVSNLHIAGGSADFILQTDGSGNLSWVAKPSSGATITDDTTTNATYYPVYATASSGTLSTAGIATTKLQFNPSTGEMTATNFNSLSDEKFKTNIKPIINALEIILKLEGVSYDWIEGGSSHGLIAQAVEKVVSNVVSSNDERKTINYSAIIPFLIEAIKTQQQTIDSHSKEINELKNQIQQILNKI
jgi:hypothetical protein